MKQELLVSVAATEQLRTDAKFISSPAPCRLLSSHDSGPCRAAAVSSQVHELRVVTIKFYVIRYVLHICILK